MKEDVSRKNVFGGFYDPLPNLDPENKIKIGVSAMKICSVCLELYGKTMRDINVSDERKVTEMRFQKCNCMKENDRRDGIEDRLWPGYDFNKVVELCWCCGKRLISSGSRFSFFFCSECLVRVRKHNENPGNFMIPLGRHTFLNGIKLNYPFTESEEEEFEKRVNSFFRKMDILAEWRKLSLVENLHNVGVNFSSDISLRYYDKLLCEQGNGIDSKFERMAEYVYEHYMND